MTKLQLLHRALNERLMAAVEQIMEMVGGTVLEYEEETIRARKENEVLRRRLRWMEGANRADWPGPSETVTLSTTDEASPSRQDEGAVNFGCGPGSEALVIKTESTEIPLCSISTLPQSIDQGPENAGTGTGIAYGLVDSMSWDSAQSYMAPLDFDPTSGPSRVRHWRGQNRRQRMSFACPDCGKVFASKQRLMVHMRIHSTERPYAYRRRKECFYGDNKKKRKLQRLSQLSRETVDDLSDGSEQMNRSEEEPESDHNNSDKEPEKRITAPVQKRRKKRGVVNQMCRCPHCPHRVFARPCQLALHMKTHSVTALINLPARAQSGTQEIVDVKRKLPKRQRKNDVEKEGKVADKRKLQCSECGKVFLHGGWFRVHMKSHNTKKVLLRRSLQIKTERTKEETTVAVPKTTEVQKVKKVKKTHACPHCDKVFTREGWLEPHIRTQHGEVRNRSDYFNLYGSGRTRSQQLATKDPECHTNSTDDNSSVFKTHRCFYCKQPHHRMMDHLQTVHPNEPEVAKALTFDKSSQERRQHLNLLQTRGNVLYNTNVVQSSKQDSKPFETFASSCSFDDRVYCIYCLGLFNTKSFVSHLEQCKGKSTLSAGASCGEMLPNAGPIPPTPALISPSSSEEIDADIKPSGFHCLNTLCEALPDLSCYEQTDISSSNEEFRNNRQAEGAILQFRRSPENEVGYELKSDNSLNPSTGQESTDYKNKGVTFFPKCDVDQESAMTPRSYTSSIGPHPEYDVLRNDDPHDDFRPPQNAQTVCNDTPKSRVKVQTRTTGKKRRKRRSRVHNLSLLMDDDLLAEGEMSNSKQHVCQHCKATFGSPYTLRRHEYTHTGERPFWCHQCNVGFIQKYRLLKHTFACHGDTPDQGKPKRAKRSIQDEETSVRDEASIEPATKSLEDLPNAVTEDTGGKVTDTRQDIELREFHWRKAEHSSVKDHDTDR
ncbi:uncharacterized protein LOC132143517 isoform X3 [Carassius carassius]|uniref:uncharacterized protein LOC132143517 isoform X3 n=1 Tax=Carassius carassius TaxID=217509 RepID=UPI0028693688|nr:uncharacterized protein LOC132143517 isoform X3 [Carassius carassius]